MRVTGVNPNYSPIPQPSEAPYEDVRRAGRVHCESIRCTLGDVVDASACGMRVRRVGSIPLRRRHYVGFSVHGPDGFFPVKAQIVWRKRTGLLRHELGLYLFDLDSETRRRMGRTIAGARENPPLFQTIRRPKRQSHETERDMKRRAQSRRHWQQHDDMGEQAERLAQALGTGHTRWNSSSPSTASPHSQR